MKIQHVPIAFVPQVWPKVAAYLEAAIAQQDGEPDYCIAHVQAYVASGQWVLFVAVDDELNFHGAATIHIFNRPNDRVAFIMYIGGRLIANKDTFEQLCTLCKSFGVTKVEGAVNEAVSRLWRRFGFKEKYRITEASLS
jgi:hypothetical protein